MIEAPSPGVNGLGLRLTLVRIGRFCAPSRKDRHQLLFHALAKNSHLKRFNKLKSRFSAESDTLTKFHKGKPT